MPRSRAGSRASSGTDADVSDMSSGTPVVAALGWPSDHLPGERAHAHPWSRRSQAHADGWLRTDDGRDQLTEMSSRYPKALRKLSAALKKSGRRSSGGGMDDGTSFTGNPFAGVNVAAAKETGRQLTDCQNRRVRAWCRHGRPQELMSACR